jgi:hypothetical protein
MSNRSSWIIVVAFMLGTVPVAHAHHGIMRAVNRAQARQPGSSTLQSGPRTLHLLTAGPGGPVHGVLAEAHTVYQVTAGGLDRGTTVTRQGDTIGRGPAARFHASIARTVLANQVEAQAELDQLMLGAQAAVGGLAAGPGKRLTTVEYVPTTGRLSLGTVEFYEVANKRARKVDPKELMEHLAGM